MDFFHLSHELITCVFFFFTMGLAAKSAVSRLTGLPPTIFPIRSLPSDHEHPKNKGHHKEQKKRHARSSCPSRSFFREKKKHGHHHQGDNKVHLLLRIVSNQPTSPQPLFCLPRLSNTR